MLLYLPHSFSSLRQTEVSGMINGSLYTPEREQSQSKIWYGMIPMVLTESLAGGWGRKNSASRSVELLNICFISHDMNGSFIAYGLDVEMMKSRLRQSVYMYHNYRVVCIFCDFVWNVFFIFS